jgi:hypothetical protein
MLRKPDYFPRVASSSCEEAHSWFSRLERLRGGRNGRWLAICPSHADRRASLSIRETHDRYLVHCFSGCTAKAICDALGIETRDLFKYPITREKTAMARPFHASSRPSIADALLAEAKRFRQAHEIEGRLLARELNDVRARVAARYDTTLAPLPIPLWDTAEAGRERDPAWPGVFWLALFRASFEITGTAIDYDPASSRTVHISRHVIQRADDIASTIMRELERAATARVTSSLE